ncbi:protein CBFA2T3 [Monomorium pharaonis]|uniref:protein CBFA2T3 n=1 Tax=Monomorium pharaonis TaxID=307658 RepID=UPI0017470965|nr:protein CBFA2T3 [Monomorium pharaonis]XP_036147091.1 protein CBFA2T3 [Monomorium pharaonis]XP_036147092.1 protein CBFA2T3 [Monomorium pharaonis]
MKVEGGVATTTVLHKVKVKEETKECCGYQQASPSSTSAAATATVATLTVSAATAITTTVTNSNGVSAVSASPSTTTTAAVVTAVATPALQASTIICHPTNAGDSSFSVDIDLKAKSKASSATREKSSREEVPQPEAHSPSSQQHQRIGQQKQTNGPRSEYKGASGCSRSSDNDSPLPSQSFKPELEEVAAGAGNAAGSRTTDEQSDGAALANGTGGASRCVSGIFAGHGKLKRLLGTLVQFATDISADTGDTVRTLVLALLSGSMTAEEFHSALQEATNFPLRSFVLPYLKHTLPSLQRDLSNAARANNQSCVQFLRSNESAVLEAVGLAPSGESVEVFGEHGGANGISGGNQCSAHYAMRSNSNPGVGTIQHAAGSNAAGALHHYPGAAHAPKRRASDTPYYENGVLLDDMPVYGKRSVNPWSHHHQQQQQQQQQQQPTDPSYCWYHPLHSSGGSIQGHAHGHGHGPSPVPPSLVQINQINAFSAPHHLTQQPQQSMGSHGLQMQNGGSLDDEWKNIHVMLNCILGMVEKTKRALAILQRRGCSSPAAAAPPPGVVTAQNGTSNNGNSNGNNPSSTNGVQVESSTGDRDGSLKRLSGEIVAQTIRATEDRVAEVKRRAEEAVLEVKRAAVAEVQRAVAVAVAESRANERLRVHRLLDLPLSQRNPGNLRPGPFLRVHGNSAAVETSARNVTTPTTTPNSAPSTTDDEKDIHLTSMMGSCCWNCGRPALETCGGCGIARYCGSFCQHRDWEAGHHTTCNNLPPREPRRSASRSPPRVAAANLSTTVNEVDATPVPSAGVAKGK